VSGLDGLELTRLLEASFDGLIVSDTTGRVLFANHAVERITGADPSRMVGRPVDELIRDGLVPYATSLEALRAHKPFTRIQKYSNGKTAVVTSSPIYDSGGEASFVLTNLRDVSLIRDCSAACGEADESGSGVFASPALKEVLEILNSLATVDSTVLFEGETGVGKDVLARMLHEKGKQRKGPFVKVNCGSLPESLLESELFGYEAGSFTGARRQGKRGLVEAAEGGTFFLDEIEALPLGLQPKFLELLQDRTFNRIGGLEKRKADIRVVAATNLDLANLVHEHRFREDLYYRLSVVPVRVPPLRERVDDIIPLARLFLANCNAKYGMNRGIANAVFPLLLSHSCQGIADRAPGCRPAPVGLGRLSSR
jgi:PAS domain S-box-containing protein